MSFSIGAWLHRVTHPTTGAAGGAEAGAPDAAGAEAGGFERVRSSVRDAVDALERRFERRFLRAHDGFIAFEPSSGAITPGLAPSAVDRDAPKVGGTIDALTRILASREHGKRITFTLGELRVDGRPTGAEAERGAPIEGALAHALLARVDPRRGGLVELGVESEDHAAPTRARVLALPRDYDGPIFVSDIDDTLRATDLHEVVEGDRQPPIPGATELLQGVAGLGVPIVYLSAAITRIREVNQDFLTQLPAGVLLDNPEPVLAVGNTASAHAQAAYKLGVLQKLKATYPRAQLFGLGDDKYGDAIAYSRAGARAFIHDVLPGDKNIPPGFSGKLTPDYSPAFRAEVLAEVGAARDASSSFGAS